MGEVFDMLKQIGKTYIVEPFSHFGVRDAIDILLLMTLFYGVYLFVKGRRAAKLATGLLLVLVFYALCDIFHLRAMYRFLGVIVSSGIILLAIIFQPEIRDSLEKLGSLPLGILFDKNQETASLTHTINEVVNAVCDIALTDKDGAIIVFEKSTKLGEYTGKGTEMDALVSSSLLCNIFYDRSPLHDGAVIIRGSRIVAASCKLPLTTRDDIPRAFGTRHRAAIGVTDVSDCVAVVVSEERHIISITNSGLIKRDYNLGQEDLRDESSRKAVQNRLQRDLYALLLGIDDSSDKPVKQRKRKAQKAALGAQATAAPQVESKTSDTAAESSAGTDAASADKKE